MGEIAEMMLDGTLCEGCGVYLDGDADGYPRCCPDCARERRRAAKQSTETHKRSTPKVSCPTCKRRVKATGLKDHLRDAHGTKEAA